MTARFNIWKGGPGRSGMRKPKRRELNRDINNAIIGKKSFQGGSIIMAEMLTKKDLAEKFAKDNGTSKKSAAEYIQYIFDAMAETLAEEGTVDIKGFGKFTISERAARTGINPSTKEQIQIPASKSIKFKPSKGLKDAVNE